MAMDLRKLYKFEGKPVVLHLAGDKGDLRANLVSAHRSPLWLDIAGGDLMVPIDQVEGCDPAPPPAA